MFSNLYEVNWTRPTEFILLGLTDNPELQIPLFVFFLLVYSVTLLWNIGIMGLIITSQTLHTPMYFLLCNLALVDILLSSVTVPNMLVNFLSERKTISFIGCASQTFAIFTVGGTEVFLVAVMAYDRYIAICNPLLYSVIMNNKVCTNFIFAVYIIATLNSLTQTTFTFTSPFCKSNQIIHFYCDIPPILKLSCSDTTLNETVLMSVAGGLVIVSLIIIIISYAYIVLAILRINSASGRRKACSTCSAHSVCVSLYYGTLIFMYGQPTSAHSTDKDRVVSVLYAVMIPMLNPLIYSLRNKEVKNALKKTTGQVCFLQIDTK